MKLLYINIYNKNYNYKLYIHKIIKNINYIYNKYKDIIEKEYNINKKNINKIINYYIDKINFNYYYQYEDNKILKYIFYLNIKNKIKFNIFKNNNIDFLFKLYKLTIKYNKKIINILKKKINNWDINIINFIDLILLKMAISEYYFINKKINIIIYEYINIIKLYSSNKSKFFLNGILDNIFKNIKIKQW
ncbi:MAG: hypothetical protein NHG06_00135 [Candidatus Shikimatogenerans sp. JK-2022]|nr:hypothetical protein [Candidatus Shikimatogenerans bostrichidophilus]